MALDYAACAKEIYETLGGRENLVSAAHCATRLRLVTVDNSKIDMRCHRPEHDPFFPAQRMVGGNGRQHPGLAPALLHRQAGRLSGPCHPGHHRRLADVSD